jgi:hypothetical protein
VAVPQDAGLVPGDVELGAGGQCRGARPGEQVRDRDVDLGAAALVALRPEREQLVCVGHDGQVEVGGLAGAGGEPLRGKAAHRGQRDLLDVGADDPPPGPLPLMVLRSIPRSRASLRASGEVRTRIAGGAPEGGAGAGRGTTVRSG